MDRRGVGIIDAIFAVALSVLVITIFIFAFGQVLDLYIVEFNEWCAPLAPMFTPALNKVLTMAEWFYLLPTIFLLLITVWLYKFIIMRQRYSRREDEEEW